MSLDVARKLNMGSSEEMTSQNVDDCKTDPLHIHAQEKRPCRNQPIPTPQEIEESRIQKDRVVLNIGGQKHVIRWECLQKYPGTRLGRLKIARTHETILELCENYSLESNEYFFDAQPQYFPNILNLYRRGRVHMPDGVCVVDFAENLAYWGIDESHLDACCEGKYRMKRDALNEEIKKDEEFALEDEEEDFGNDSYSAYKKYVWELFEKSDTVTQKVVGMTSMFVILVSIVTLSLSTLPELQSYDCKLEVDPLICDEILKTWANTSSSEELPEEYFDMSENEIMNTIELVCVVWFTMEYVLRLLSAPNKIKFFKGVLNAIDLIAITPFYVSLFLVQLGSSGRLLQTLRVIRIFRIFKLARHSVGLQSLGFTLRRSYKNLGILFLFLSVGVVMFSTLAYFAEKGTNTSGFESIPHSFYWALITMTTVGYGDITPVTFLGRLVGMMSAVCGIIVIALPVPIVVNNFSLFYEEQMRKEKALKRHKDLQTLRELDALKSSHPI